MGLLTNHGGGGDFTETLFVGESQINAKILVSPGFGSVDVGDSSTLVTFRIRRVGNSIFEEYDTGGGFQSLHSATDAALAGPVGIELFLRQEFGPTDSHVGTFDNLLITSDGILPEPGTALLLCTGLLLGLASRRRRSA